MNVSPNLRRETMKIKNNVYLLESTKGSYVYYLGGDEPVLIDTSLPFKCEALIRELESMGVADSIKHILVTHHDLDHVGNLVSLQQRTGANIWASAADIPYITGETRRPGFKGTISRIMRVKKPASINAFSEGQSIAGVTVVATPGHTPGHVCFLYDGVLFAGDLIENKKGVVMPYPAPWTIDPKALLESIKNVEQLEFDWVCPAHGLPFKRSGRAICNQ
jgi:glyoxylase-like metal-dependent hydrolase (beta-lactamase superfamily II)